MVEQDSIRKNSDFIIRSELHWWHFTLWYDWKNFFHEISLIEYWIIQTSTCLSHWCSWWGSWWQVLDVKGLLLVTPYSWSILCDLSTPCQDSQSSCMFKLLGRYSTVILIWFERVITEFIWRCWAVSCCAYSLFSVVNNSNLVIYLEVNGDFLYL